MRIQLEEAVRRIRESVKPLPAAEHCLADAIGCILAEELIAPIDQPPFPRSPYDGYALRAEDSTGAGEDAPVRLRVVGRSFAGVPADVEPGRNEAVRIMTGGVIPPGADCVIMQEQTDGGETEVLIYRSLRPFENYCFAGEDYHSGEKLAEAGERATAAVCAVASGAGKGTLSVFPRPVVTVFSTGSEIRLPGTPLLPGQIYTSNNAYLRGRLTELGIPVRELAPVDDDVEKLTAAYRDALRLSDMVITTGGVSVGQRDLVPEALEAIGSELVFHGVDIKPGMPACLALCGGKPVLALSGNPFAAAASFELLGRSVCAALASDKGLEPDVVRAGLAMDYGGKTNCRRFLSGRLEDGTVSIPAVQSNGRLKSMVGCNCLVEIREGDGALRAGAEVPAWML